VQPGSTVKLERFAQKLKQQLGIASIDKGTQTDRSDEHFSTVQSPKRERRQLASNVKYNSVLHAPKSELEIVSLDEGIQVARRGRV
jgi:hypothetical protein